MIVIKLYLTSLLINFTLMVLSSSSHFKSILPDGIGEKQVTDFIVFFGVINFILLFPVILWAIWRL